MGSCKVKQLIKIIFPLSMVMLTLMFSFTVSAYEATPEPDLLYVTAVAWSHDGTKIAAVGTGIGSPQGYVRVLDVETGKVLYALDPNPGGYTSVAWSPDDRFIAMGSYDQSVWVVDLIAGKVVAGLFGHRATVTDVSWSPDGKQLVSSGNWDGLTILWDATTYQKIREVEASGSFPQAVGYSPDGQRIAVSGEGGIRVYAANGGTKPVVWPDYRFNISAFAWSHDGNHIVFGTQTFTNIIDSHHQVYAQVYIIDSKTGMTVNQWATANTTITDILWSPNDEWIAAESIDGVISVWDSETGKALTVYGGNIGHDVQFFNHISFNPSGNQIAYGIVIPSIATPNYNITENSPLYLSEQMWRNGIEVFVPLPSLDQLNAAIQDCEVELTLENQVTTLVTSNDLGAVRKQIMAMKSGQISPTCKADILAITRALLRQ